MCVAPAALLSPSLALVASSLPRTYCVSLGSSSCEWYDASRLLQRVSCSWPHAMFDPGFEHAGVWWCVACSRILQCTLCWCCCSAWFQLSPLSHREEAQTRCASNTSAARMTGSCCQTHRRRSAHQAGIKRDVGPADTAQEAALHHIDACTWMGQEDTVCA